MDGWPLSTRTPFAPLSFRSRLPALDGLRAVAVMLVFFEHYGGGSHGNRLLQCLNAFRAKGWLGVDIFFVLSGFLITGILYDTTGDSRYYTRFLARRSLRILPLYYGVFLLLLLLTPLLHYQWLFGHLLWAVYLGNIIGNLDFSYYLIFSANHLPWSANLGHFWSLCVEEQFYLLWPWMVYRIRDRKRLIWAASCLSGLALAFRGIFYVWVGPNLAERWIVRSLLFRMDALLIGAILALLLRGPNADAIQRRCGALCICCALPLVVIFLKSPSPGSPWMLTIGYSLTALASAGFIGLILRPVPILSHFLNLGPCQALGRVSYGFYVFHNLFFYVWLEVLRYLILHLGGLALPGLLEIAGAFITTWTMSFLSFKYIESGFLQFKRHFLYDQELSLQH